MSEGAGGKDEGGPGSTTGPTPELRPEKALIRRGAPSSRRRPLPFGRPLTTTLVLSEAGSHNPDLDRSPCRRHLLYTSVARTLKRKLPDRPPMTWSTNPRS